MTSNGMSRMWKVVFIAALFLPFVSHAATIAELQAQLAALQQQVAALILQQTNTAAPPSTSPWQANGAASCLTLTRNLSRGMRGEDVRQLQQFLISQNLLAADSLPAPSTTRQAGATGFFGALTEAAVKKFQCRQMQICSGSPAVNGYGAVGPRTRATIQNRCSTANVPPVPEVKDCVVSGITIRNNDARSFYNAPSVVAPASCRAQSRVCTNGVLLGDIAYQYPSCTTSSVTPPQPPPPIPPPTPTPGANGIFSVKDFGAKCDASTDDTSAIQKAEDARETAGGTLSFPSGFCIISGTISIKKGGIIQGVGHGQTGNSGSASVIRTNSLTADVFNVTTTDAVTFREMQIDSGSTVKSQGTAILIQPSLPPYDNLMNRQSRIESVSIYQMANGIALYNSANFSIRDNFIMDFHNNGIYVTQNSSVIDQGDAIISGNTIWDLNVTEGAAGIRLDPAAAIAITANKILGATRGVWLTVSQGPMGTINIASNSIEQQSVSGFYVEQTTAGKTYGNITVNANQFSIMNIPGAQSAITFAAGAAGSYLTNAVISNNVFNMALDQLAIIHLSVGDGVNISGNVLNNLGHNGAFGIITDNQAKNVTIFGNTFSNIPSGNYGPLTAGTTVQN